MLFYICLSLGVISLILFLAQRKPEVSLKVLLFKTATSGFFILTAFAAAYENPDCSKTMSHLFFAGAVCGMLGDIWLDAKYLFPSEESGLLKAGFISFLIGHVFYITAMLTTYGISTLYIIFAIFGFVAGAISCVVTEKVMKADFGKSKLISIIYTSVLAGAMGISAATALKTDFSWFSLFMSTGMGLFLASDIVLARIYFCKGGNTRLNVVVNHALYYVAQFIIASSLFVF
ncbi:MAG: hypothetical protein IKC01_02845 [Clostridia bacterium]|nr:hypothetical protein [Clostridia bacterium]